MSNPTSPGLYGSKGGDTTPPANTDPVPPPPDTSGDDVLPADAGNATLYGGKGQDTAVFEGQLSDYLISFDPTSWQVVVTDRTGRDGAHHLSSIERLRFGDTTIALDGVNGLMRPVRSVTTTCQLVGSKLIR
jgi:Ca2+-binding RTX toxin-like protein